ncbi:MAG: iron-containing alcohol dehydrogenase [Verrucomicrobiota bacterium]|nr:iron-containing alcohol dehydrogenase [Verrucomicrobiota bacterium]
MNTLSLEEFSNDSFFGGGANINQKVLFSEGISSTVGEHAKTFGTHAFLVSDPGIREAGHVDRVKNLIQDAGVQVTVFDQSIENPTESSVALCASIAKEAKVDLIVGLGGGSSMDTAKGCNFILTNGGKMENYWGVGKAEQPMLPLIAIPTTAGTGSECQSFALISQDKTHAKMACGDPKALPAVTLLDPELTLSQPASVSACTGIDALAHSLESAVTRKRTDLSDRHARIAFRLLNQFLPIVFSDPNNLKARGGVLLGASHAGAAIEQSMLGAAHSMANPLTARYGTIHGIAVGLALPLVIKFNIEESQCRTTYANFAQVSGLSKDHCSETEGAEILISRIEELLSLSKISTYQNGMDFEKSAIPELAAYASKQWTASFNPRPVQAVDFEILYEQLFQNFLEETSISTELV